MAKVSWKPGNMLYPLPAVLISCGNKDLGFNAFTVAWAGTVCTNPPMTSISVRPERHSYRLIKETGEFVINLTTEALVKAVDYCGVRSGKKENKLALMGLDYEAAQFVSAPIIKESPVNIECRVKSIQELGSHHMFIADVVGMNVDDQYIDDKNKLHLEWTKPICYSHGTYYGLGNSLGTFGYSVRKQKKKEK